MPHEDLLDASGEAEIRLRYVDFICSVESMEPIVARVQRALPFKCTIELLSASEDCSGPREEEAIAIFTQGVADAGRM